MNSKYTDLSNSFPAAVDTIDKMQDLTITTKKKADKYYEYINANNITGANDYLGKSENSDLLLSVFNADKFNTLRDMIISIERFEFIWESCTIRNPLTAARIKGGILWELD